MRGGSSPVSNRGFGIVAAEMFPLSARSPPVFPAGLSPGAGFRFLLSHVTTDGGAAPSRSSSRKFHDFDLEFCTEEISALIISHHFAI